MLRITVDGAIFEHDLDSSAELVSKIRVSEVVSLVRTELPADRLIIQVARNDSLLNEDDWESIILPERDENVTIWTAPKFDHLTRRLETAASYLTQIRAEFSQAAFCFKAGDPAFGNAALATAVDNFLAFVHWYTTILLLDRDALHEPLQRFHGQVEKLHLLCEDLVSQQMFENVIVLGEILHSRLDPALAKLQDECNRTTAVSPGVVVRLTLLIARRAN